MSVCYSMLRGGGHASSKSVTSAGDELVLDQHRALIIGSLFSSLLLHIIFISGCQFIQTGSPPPVPYIFLFKVKYDNIS